MPTSKDTRVRVEGFSKISATLRPASAREDSGARLELERAVEQRVQLGGVSSAPVRKWRGHRSEPV